MHIDGKVAARFWPKVAVSDGCWLWTGARVPSGYGSIGVDGRQHGAHRISWAMANGSWPEGMVLHRCGVHQCVRPDHLYVGTGSENSEDARRHGTLALGEGHGNTKVTDDQVAEMRRRYAAGDTQTAIAADFPVTQSQVSNIVRGVQRGGGSVTPPTDPARYDVTCAQCGETFQRKPGARTPRFCSAACRGASQRQAGARTCPVCHTSYYRPPSAKGETCSYTCMGKLRSMRLTN